MNAIKSGPRAHFRLAVYLLLQTACVMPDVHVSGARDAGTRSLSVSVPDASDSHPDSGQRNMDAGALVDMDASSDVCAKDNGGCDPLTICATTTKGERFCGDCPRGYVGNGDEPCRPTLTGLTLSMGELTPTLSAETTQYRVSVPITTTTITLKPQLPDGVRAKIAGTSVATDGAWTSQILNLGANTFTVEVEADGRPKREYQLVVERGRQQAYLKASNTRSGARFASVAISGDTLVVGADGESSAAIGVNNTSPGQSDNSSLRSGAAYVFVRHGNDWVQQAYLKASNTGEDDWFGSAVAISGDTIVVGAPNESSLAKGVDGVIPQGRSQWTGAAYVFTRVGTTWGQQAYLKASNPDGTNNGGLGDQFGWDVAVEGDTILIGAPGESSAALGVNNTNPGPGDNSVLSAGAAYVFVRSGGTWKQDAYLKPSWVEKRMNFGWSVGISGSSIVVGAYGECSARTGVSSSTTDPAQSDRSALGSGAAYVFVHDAGTWSQQACLKASNTGELDSFGLSVAISGDTVVVGAGEEPSAGTGINNTKPGQGDNSAENAGAAYVFVRANGRWSQQAYLKASNTGAGDWFNNVAIAGDTILVGACSESSAATGINNTNPGQADDSASASGAVYVFGRTAAVWSQLGYLKASNTDADDRFCVVALSNDTIVVGAANESSATVGTSSSPPGQSDNSAPQSGAVYVFR